jgi:hypothetical protein
MNSNNSINRATEDGYLDYSPYKKYFIKKNDQQAHWKIDRKRNQLITNAKASSIISRNLGSKIKLPHLSNKGNLTIDLNLIEIKYSR